MKRKKTRMEIINGILTTRGIKNSDLEDRIE